MTKPGHIEITDKVRFVFHELPKPEQHMFSSWRGVRNTPIHDTIGYDKAIKAYEASKQTVEVSNAKKCENTDEICVIFLDINLDFPDHFVKNNQKCKAEVNGIAKIIELIK